MLCCQFPCHVLKALFLIKIALKLSYFCKKIQNFEALEAPPGGFTPSLQRLEASPPDPHWLPAAGGPPPDPQNILPPIANFWLRA